MSRTKTTTLAKRAPTALLGDIRALIEAAHHRAAAAVNAELTLLFWRVGQRIHTEVLAEQRAGYGEEILSTLAAKLALEYGRGFGEKNLRRMVKFAATFPEEPIVATLSRQLSWSHFVLLLALKKPMQRDYYYRTRPDAAGAGFLFASSSHPRMYAACSAVWGTLGQVRERSLWSHRRFRVLSAALPSDSCSAR